jgi:hypothetical protein
MGAMWQIASIAGRSSQLRVTRVVGTASPFSIVEATAI